MTLSAKMTDLIHKNSEPYTKSELDWFIMLPTQTAGEKGYCTEYFPVANIDEYGPIEFNEW